MKAGSTAVFLLLLAWFLALPAARGICSTTGYRELTAPEVKKMVAERRCVLIHSLSRIEFAIQHIEHSINIPVVEMETTDRLPADKSTPLIFYCMGKR
jgi:rhodanese-related sulfurtransferase